MTQPETITMTEVTNGQIDPAHYGPTGDIARNIASYCQGNARAHVYTAAFAALTTAQAEAEAKDAEIEALGEALHGLSAMLLLSGALNDEKTHVAYEKVVARIAALRARNEGEA